MRVRVRLRVRVRVRVRVGWVRVKVRGLSPILASSGGRVRGRVRV